MSARVDTTTKLSYLLPTGTFLTFQVLAPLATNNGKCGATERILTAVMLALLVGGCVVTSFTDSFTTQDGKVYIGFLTYKGLWVPGYGGPESDQDIATIQGSSYYPKAMDYINAALSAIAFLALTMFTDPVCTCFYPNISETILKTLPVLLATVLSFCCSFTTKIRRGYGNSVPKLVPAPPAASDPSLVTVRDSSIVTDKVDSNRPHEATGHRGNNVV